MSLSFPFYHHIIDDFLDEDQVIKISQEFPEYNSNYWFYYNNPLENKKSCNNWYAFGPETYKTFVYLNSKEFISKLQEIAGIEKLYPDIGLHGGWAFIEVPSTEGNGAWCDPTHVSFWNEDSFPYYTKQSKAQFIRNKDIRFCSLRLETNWWPETKIAVVNTHLVALKEGPRFPGSVEI